MRPSRVQKALLLLAEVQQLVRSADCCICGLCRACSVADCSSLKGRCDRFRFVCLLQSDGEELCCARIAQAVLSFFACDDKCR
jgi:hypothetical protein